MQTILSGKRENSFLSITGHGNKSDSVPTAVIEGESRRGSSVPEEKGKDIPTQRSLFLKKPS